MDEILSTVLADKEIIQIHTRICTNRWLADTTEKLKSSKKRASPLSPGTWECVRLVPKNLRHGPYNLRHGLIRFRFCTRTIRTPSKIRDLYKSISMPCYSQPTREVTIFLAHRTTPKMAETATVRCSPLGFFWPSLLQKSHQKKPNKPNWASALGAQYWQRPGLFSLDCTL